MSATPGIRHGASLDAAAEFAVVLSRVAELDDIDDGDGPTEHALASTVKLLSAVRPLVGAVFLRASASTTDAGGIHVYWERPGRTVLLSVPPASNEVSFIYHRDRDGYAADKDVTPQSLAHWLRWLADE